MYTDREFFTSDDSSSMKEGRILMRKTQEKNSNETTQVNVATINVSTDVRNNFIMLPTVDFCFKELMHNEKVRKGILAAILNVHPDEVEHTELLPTILRKEYSDIMEIHILELPKLPPEQKEETDLIQWMRFLGGKNREDLRRMAEKNSDFQEAYNELDRLSADEQKRLEYESRQKAIRDKNILLKTGIERGREEGRIEGIRAIIHLAELVNLDKNEIIQQLAEGMHMTVEEAEKWYENCRENQF